MSREIRQLFIPHNSGSYFCEITFGHFGEAVIHPGAHDEIEHGVTEEFEPFIILA